MIISKDTKIGKLEINIPIEINDIIVNKHNEYPISRFIIYGESDNHAYSIRGPFQISIYNLEKIREIDGRKYFKIID